MKEKTFIENKKEPVLGQPQYCVGDLVRIKVGEIEMDGNVYIVDSYGTFEQKVEPSYDVMMSGEFGLYKHIRESEIIGKYE